MSSCVRRSASLCFEIAFFGLSVLAFDDCCVLFLQPERFVSLGIEPPKGVLLYGPPGTGKTLCARAVANRTDACFIRVIGSELVQKYVGEVSSQLPFYAVQIPLDVLLLFLLLLVVMLVEVAGVFFLSCYCSCGMQKPRKASITFLITQCGVWLCRVLEWCVNSSKWLARRRRVSFSSMKSTPLVVSFAHVEAQLSVSHNALFSMNSETPF